MIIVMTGGTSGIGAQALDNIVKTSKNKVFTGARGSGRLVPDEVSLLPLNLSSLKSVPPFAENIQEILGNNKIDILVLNAGIQVVTVKP